MRAWPALLVAACCAPAVVASPLPDDLRAWLDERGPIRMCVDPDWMPMESLDAEGRHVGMAADFIALMAERGGLDIRVVPAASWGESWEMAQRRECDIVPLLMESPARLALFDFTTPYLEIPSVIATSASVPFVPSIRYVLDQPLGHMRGFAGIELLRERYPGIKLVEVDSYDEGLLRVQTGELFGMLGNMASIGASLQRLKAVDLKIAGWVGRDSLLSVATRNDEPRLHEAFQLLLDSIDEAERQGIMNRWMAVRFEHRFDYRLLWQILAVLLVAGAAVSWWTVKLRRLNRRLDELNRHDPLTGLHNRMHFDETALATVRQCSRHGLLLALAMIDIDRLKKINDTHGHAFGDACLRHLAGLLTGAFQRETDGTFRYGGEEFVVICVGTDRTAMLSQFEAFRRTVEERSVESGGRRALMTVSIGVWCGVPEPDADPAAILELADAALYRAKDEGRNRVLTA